jgi:hypothetical protein
MILLPLSSGTFKTTLSWRHILEDFRLQQEGRTNLNSRTVHILEPSDMNPKYVAMFPVRKLHQRKKRTRSDSHMVEIMTIGR